MTKPIEYALKRTVDLSKFVDTPGDKRKFKGASTKKGFGPVSHSFQKAFAPTSFTNDAGGSMNWSGINASGVNIGSNTAAGPAGPATESIMVNKFITFLESLKNEENSRLLKTVETGFNACFEAKKIQK